MSGLINSMFRDRTKEREHAEATEKEQPEEAGAKGSSVTSYSKDLGQ